MSPISRMASHHQGRPQHAREKLLAVLGAGACASSGFDQSGRGMLGVLHSLLGILSQTAVNA